MSEMVERVGRAILAKVPQGYGMTEAEAREYACAAIEEMGRRPTEAMALAAAKVLDDYIEVTPPVWETYKALMDAALNEKAPPHVR